MIEDILKNLETTGKLRPGEGAQLMEKVAALPGWVRRFIIPVARPAGAVALASLAVGGLSAAKTGADALVNIIRRGSDYRRMMEEWGDKSELVNYDPELVRKAFDTVHRMSPHMAREPYIVGPMVRDMILHGQDPSNLRSVRLEPVQAERLMAAEQAYQDRSMPSKQSTDLLRMVSPLMYPSAEDWKRAYEAGNWSPGNAQAQRDAEDVAERMDDADPNFAYMIRAARGIDQ